jgi:hypothetical protein
MLHRPNGSNSADPRRSEGPLEIVVRPRLSHFKLELEHLVWDWKAMLLQECELVPISALENDLPVLYVEEPAAPQANGIFPLENRPLTILEYVLDDTDHFCSFEPLLEHCADLFPPFDRVLRDLVIHRIR